MPYLRENLVLNTLDNGEKILRPNGAYIRIAKVEQVYLNSKNMIVQFIDGSRDDDMKFIEEPVTVETVIGSMDPLTTLVPSATVYGKGDLCAVIVLEDQTMYAASPLDLHNNLNRENWATIKEFALYEVLDGLLVDALDDDENSYLTFWDPVTNNVTKIEGDTSKNKFFEKLVYYHTRAKNTTCGVSTLTDPGWQWDAHRSGPDNNPEQRIDGRLHKGMYVNGMPYVEDRKFGQPTDLNANLTLYSNTLTDLEDAMPHPLNTGELTDRFFEHATVIWFPDDDPTHVIMMGTWPTLDACQHVAIVEVPVYCLAGRKYLEREIIDEGLPTEEKNIVQSWQRYDDQIRVLKLIPRDYIDFTAHGTNKIFSERLHKSISVYHPRVTSNVVNFGYIDGYGYDQGGSIFNVNKVNKVTGSITRTEILPETPSYFNGSRYRYTIQNTNGLANGYVDNWYSTRFQYEWNSGNEWEQQTSNDPNKQYPCYTDGVNEMYRTIEFSYYCDGHYDESLIGTGATSWYDGQNGGTSDSQEITNDWWHRTYRNGQLRWTEQFSFRKTAADGMWGSNTTYSVIYADVEYDLYIITKIVTTVDQGSSFLGPGYTCTGNQTAYGIVLFQGTEYIIWQCSKDLDTFPAVYNFWPWIDDTSVPERPTETPYSVDQNYNGIFCYEPQMNQYILTPRTGYSTVGLGFPSPLYSTESIPQIGIVDLNAGLAQPADLLWVSIDKHNDSFIIRFESYLRTITNGQTLTYPGGGNTLLRLNGSTPHFNVPAVTGSIQL